MTSLKILKKLMTVGGLVSSMESEDSSHQIMWRSSFELPGMDHCNDMLAEVSWFFFLAILYLMLAVCVRFEYAVHLDFAFIYH